MDLNERLTADFSHQCGTCTVVGVSAHRLYGAWRLNKYQRTEIFATFAFLIILLNGLHYSQTNLLCVRADDSAAAPAFDMSALASLASNLGSNPQIMSLVSNLLNPGGQQKPAVGSASGSQGDLGGMGDVESNSIDKQGGGGTEPLRRSVKPSPAPTAPDQQPPHQAQDGSAPPAPPPSSPPSQAPSAQPAAPTGQPSGSPPSSSPANPLGGLMSMLPGLLSGISGGSGGGGGGPLNLGALSGLLGLNKLTPPAQPPAGDANSGGAPSGTPAPAASAPKSAAPASAQQVINHVLTTYASGQIPNELIQLGLSGRVPPQIIELALSGQVPIDMIKMVITGQVPMATINTFLSAIQQVAQPPPAQAAAGASGPSKPSASSPGVFSQTRSLFETLFGLGRSKGDASHPESGKSSITVPTLIGPIPLKLPSMPNMRSLGQLVGGAITNFSSMIPF